jgi:hypothetical protein
MDRGSVTAVISDMVSRAALDTDVVALLMDNYEELNELRMASQFEAVKEYQEIGARVQALSC